MIPGGCELVPASGIQPGTFIYLWEIYLAGTSIATSEVPNGWEGTAGNPVNIDVCCPYTAVISTQYTVVWRSGSSTYEGFFAVISPTANVEYILPNPVFLIIEDETLKYGAPKTYSVDISTSSKLSFNNVYPNANGILITFSPVFYNSAFVPAPVLCNIVLRNNPSVNIFSGIGYGQSIIPLTNNDNFEGEISITPLQSFASGTMLNISITPYR